MRHLISYLLFVGVPFGGLLVILRIGERVQAPAAVHGSYAVLPMASPGRVCHRYLLLGGDSTVRITQSGRQLTATLGPASDITLQGTLSGQEISLEGEVMPGTTPRQVACVVGDTIRVTAQLRREGRHKRLDATMWSSGCEECGGVGFMAERPRRYQGRRRA